MTPNREQRALAKIVDAWEYLEPGEYRPVDIENWLAVKMKPAIDHARRVLRRKLPGMKI